MDSLHTLTNLLQMKSLSLQSIYALSQTCRGLRRYRNILYKIRSKTIKNRFYYTNLVMRELPIYYEYNDTDELRIEMAMDGIDSFAYRKNKYQIEYMLHDNIFYAERFVNSIDYHVSHIIIYECGIGSTYFKKILPNNLYCIFCNSAATVFSNTIDNKNCIKCMLSKHLQYRFHV